MTMSNEEEQPKKALNRVQKQAKAKRQEGQRALKYRAKKTDAGKKNIK